MSSSKAELISQSDYFPMLNHPQGKAAGLTKPMTASKQGRILKNHPVQKQLTFDQGAALPGSSKSIPKKLLYHQNTLSSQDAKLAHTTKKPPRSGYIATKQELRAQYTNSKRPAARAAEGSADSLHMAKYNLIPAKAPRDPQEGSGRQSIKFSKQSSVAQIRAVPSKDDKAKPKQPPL